MDEVIWVDENDRELGIISRERAHGEGLRHRIAVVYVTRADGQILVQERMNGRLDHSSAGHVDPGEDYLTAAKRELREELGMSAELREVGRIISAPIEHEPGGRVASHAFGIFFCAGEPGELAADEVKGVFWAEPEEVWADMQKDVGGVKYTGGFKVTLGVYLGKVKL